MRPATPTLLLSAALLTALSACVPDKRATPEWQKPPETWNPTGDELTFGAKGLEKFNNLGREQQDAFAEQLKTATGTFKGQAMAKTGAVLGDKMDDAKHGSYELVAQVPDPVLFEILVDYRLYTTPEIGKTIAPNAFIEFTGTLAELQYQADTKPRKLSLKVKTEDVKVLGR